MWRGLLQRQQAAGTLTAADYATLGAREDDGTDDVPLGWPELEAEPAEEAEPAFNPADPKGKGRAK